MSTSPTRLVLALMWLVPGTGFGHTTDLCQTSTTIKHVLDPSSQWTDREAFKELNHQPVLAKSPTLNYGYTSGTVWVLLSTTHPSPDECIVRIGNSHIDHINLSVPGDGRPLSILMGDTRAFRDRPIKVRDFSFRLPGQDALLEIRSRSSITTPLRVMSEEHFITDVGFDNMMMGGFIGMMLILTFMGLYYSVTYRNRAYAIYGLSVASYLFFFLSADGLTYQHLWSNSTDWRQYALLIIALITMITNVWYYLAFLKTRSRWLRYPSLLYMGICVVTGILITEIPGDVLFPSLVLLSLGLPVATLALSIGAIVSGNRLGYYLLAAAATSTVGLFVYHAAIVGTMPLNHLTEHSIKYSSLADFIFLSMAIRRQVKDRAEKQVLYKGVFESAHMMAHDILRPLTNLSIALKQSKLGSTLETVINRDIQDVIGMVRGLLDSSKQSVVTVEPYKATISDFEQLVPTDYQVEVNIEPTLVICRLTLKRIIRNLTDNAKKATKNQKSPFFWFVVNHNHKNNMVEIRIGNTGSSIPEDKLREIFDLFNMAGDSSGYGIGLATVKNYVEAYGGNIAVESNGLRSTGSRGVKRFDGSYVEFLIKLPTA